MIQKISKARKYIEILIAIIVVPYISSVILLDVIIDSFLWSIAGYSLIDDSSRLGFIIWIAFVIMVLEIIGLIIYKRYKSIANE